MDNGVTRRTALKVGAGAVGMAGAMAVGAGTSGAAPWTWKATGSVAGHGAGKDPKRLYDPEMDALMADVLERHDVHKVNRLIKPWVANDQPIPRGLPKDLREYLEEARRLPKWTSQHKLNGSFKFVRKQDTLISVLYAFASGMMATVIPNEARAVYYSHGGSPVYFKDRIAKTAKLGYDIGTVNAYGPGGQMIVTCLKVRMVHSAVRHLLPQAPHWPSGIIPISQEDMLVTWHSLGTTIMKTMREWGVPIPKDESDGYLHSWQLCGHFLGIPDEYLPATWPQAYRQSDLVLKPALGPTSEGTVLAGQLLELGHDLDLSLLSKPILAAFTRFILGPKLADWIQVPREPVWSPMLEIAWRPFLQVRQGLLDIAPPIENAYWLFDEFLRQFVLWYMAELRMPISITIPAMNRKF